MILRHGVEKNIDKGIFFKYVVFLIGQTNSYQMRHPANYIETENGPQ
jgi:hypothetical protein